MHKPVPKAICTKAGPIARYLFGANRAHPECGLAELLDGPHRSRGIDQNNFRILDFDDLHRAQVGDRRIIPRLDADIPDIGDARGWNQISVPFGV